MHARLVDLESGRSWELELDRGVVSPWTNGTERFHFRINHRPSAEVSLPKPWISKHHAEVQLRDGGWWVVDGGCVNTVTVNGERVERERALEDGDVIGLGDTRLRVELGGPRS